MELWETEELVVSFFRTLILSLKSNCNFLTFVICRVHRPATPLPSNLSFTFTSDLSRLPSLPASISRYYSAFSTGYLRLNFFFYFLTSLILLLPTLSCLANFLSGEILLHSQEPGEGLCRWVRRRQCCLVVSAWEQGSMCAGWSLTQLSTSSVFISATAGLRKATPALPRPWAGCRGQTSREGQGAL